MIPKKQTRLHRGNKPEEKGNCFPAVIASMLEMEVDEVIQIQEHYNELDWMPKLTYWLGKMGYEYSTADHFRCFHPELGQTENADVIREELKDKYYFVSGQSPRNKSIHHIVIFQNGKMIHDPHPDGTGIMTMENFTMLEGK